MPQRPPTQCRLALLAMLIAFYIVVAVAVAQTTNAGTQHMSPGAAWKCVPHPSWAWWLVRGPGRASSTPAHGRHVLSCQCKSCHGVQVTPFMQALITQAVRPSKEPAAVTDEVCPLSSCAPNHLMPLPPLEAFSAPRETLASPAVHRCRCRPSCHNLQPARLWMAADVPPHHQLI